MYLEGVLPWKSSKWIPPPAAEMARIRKEAGTYEEAGLGEGDFRGSLGGETARGDEEEHEKVAEHAE